MLLDKHSSKVLEKADKKVYELTSKGAKRPQSCKEYHMAGFSALKKSDEQIYDLITKEYNRRQNSLLLVAAENQCSPAVLAALGSVVQNKTAEGFPGARLHGGCEVVDEVEEVAQLRAKEVFSAQYVNVQPHSGSQANQIVLTALLTKADKVLSFGLEDGGHPSHGGAGSFAGKFFDVESYTVNKTSFLLDYNAIRAQAVKIKPKLIICGASAYAGRLVFKKFRDIADMVGAYLLADISHISGLVAAGAHPSPIDYAHFTTTSTYKAGGPRGGMILMGKDYQLPVKIFGRDLPLWKHIQQATFPGVQGTPYFNHIAAKAVFFKEMLSDEYKARQFKIVENAQRLANELVDLGYDVVTGGTDNHMILVNVGSLRDGLTGFTAQKCLEDCGIIVDMIRLPYDKRPALVTSGIRLGTAIVTKQAMGAEEMQMISVLMDKILKKVCIISDREYEIDGPFRDKMKEQVRDLCGRFAA
jgi:glycine hydroxymethyltransferase